LAFFDSFLEIISSRSPVPSENFEPCYKESGGNAAFLTADHADITDARVGGTTEKWSKRKKRRDAFLDPTHKYGPR
jgi:hypothetical protein